eukprot:CAMPEP_0185589726 /NCGR_PEP_ID=MMETSP0434-20130131/58156_1 /TAXON_ID=626734 ORGANISM="Favella taraikaensis, Strain Fe Narragansett Bay" /NCGR_SAMPLE_ID=MMETSP0434 /ASSEMBLY_ACC=CAM_ASM_000379 /LENGTH=142 /DNA_ID=CAMNT_0028213381 /DNA_START=1078 /DNA_END=1507 /DNA_ORIENTATION=-
MRGATIAAIFTRTVIGEVEARLDVGLLREVLIAIFDFDKELDLLEVGVTELQEELFPDVKRGSIRAHKLNDVGAETAEDLFSGSSIGHILIDRSLARDRGDFHDKVVLRQLKPEVKVEHGLIVERDGGVVTVTPCFIQNGVD